jgi:hypothetical protein
MNSKLTADYFRKLYKYEPLTGKIISNYCGGRIKFGQQLALSTDSGGYPHMNIAGKLYPVHRLAVLYMTGNFPAPGTGVDHINRVVTDNRWENLRVITQSQNGMNRGLSTNNTSGVKGVSWHPRKQLWNVKITVARQQIHVGSYPVKEAAIAARKIAEAKYHGEFAAQE